ncbi:hypothetical protein Lal_00037367 [Lupinus albus]|nr:hypothetical protein Lal_00037367 [Lupinus albus]
MDIYKYDGMWTYFEDVDFYPETTDLPPPENRSDEELVGPPIYCSLFTAKLQFTNYSSETPILHGVVNMNMFTSATIAHRELFITERADPHFIKFVNSILEDEEDLESYLAPKTFWALQVEDVFGNFSNQDCSTLQSC